MASDPNGKKQPDPPEHDENNPQTRSLGGFDVVIFSIAVGVMLVILGLVLWLGANERVALVSAVLGPLATITAAVFGISVGNNVGEAKGKAQGDAAADSARQSKQEMANHIANLVPKIDAVVETLKGHQSVIAREFNSPPGVLVFQLQADDLPQNKTVTIDPSGLRDAETKLAALRAQIEEISSR